MIGHHFSAAAFTIAPSGLGSLPFAWNNFHSEIHDPRSHSRINQSLHGCRIEFANHVLRRALRSEDSGPCCVGESRQSHFANRRDVGGGSETRVACHRIGFNAARTHQRQLFRSTKQQINLTSQEVLHCWRHTSIGHHGKLSAGLLLKEDSR
jgi:hypothetical protein